MPLSPGTRLGPYEIVWPLGAGGMGEVYRATDTRLRRDVALKVLPEALANDPDRMERMRREAQTLAALNHPHIAAIHGVEGHALVMELVDGVTLRGPLPLDAALRCARQMAEALEHAHEKGIIHRDLKPANIKITPDGAVKILDFGLAKIVDDGPAPPLVGDVANSPTISARATEAGLVLGTAAYMAPEQARGAPVDRRADIWAFGVVLYEMLTGRPLFPGETVSDILANVLKSDIELTALPGDTPPAIRTLVRRCLERDRKQRLQAIGEARIVIDSVLAGNAAAEPAATAVRPTKWIVATGVLAAFALMLLAWIVVRGRDVAPDALAVEFDVALPEALGNVNFIGFPTVSPDGRYIAITGVGGVFVRPIDSSTVVRLDQPKQGAFGPFWSPDSRFVAYFTGRQIKRAAVPGGGATQVVADLPFEPRDAAWRQDGTIVVAQDDGPLFRVAAEGGAPIAISALDRATGEIGHHTSGFLPDGRLIYLATRIPPTCGTGNCPQTSAAYVRAIESNTGSLLMEDATNIAYVGTPSGDEAVLFSRAGQLWAQRFDAGSLALSGEAVRLASEVSGAAWSASANGVFVYRAVPPPPQFSLVWFNRSGVRLGTVGEVASYSNPALSPDERWLAVAVADPTTRTRDIWITDLVRKATSRLTSEPGDKANPRWSPDGQTILYSWSESFVSVRNIYRRRASGVGPPEPVLKTQANQKNVEDVTPDGRHVLFNVNSGDIWAAPLDGRGPASELVSGEFNQEQANLSSDGRWIAYRSSESGGPEVYVQSFPPGSQRWQISNAGGGEPQWSRDGRELFYLSGDQLMVVPIAARGGGIQADLPRALFRVSVEQVNRRNKYLVADNGQRFLVAEPTAQTAPMRVVVRVNWTLPPSE
jgi:Tol biopolymer transport system component